MNSETQGKLMVAMVISILAFGLGTGIVLITGQYHNINTLSTLNTTIQGDFPVVPSTTNNNLNSNITSSQSSSGTSQSSSSQSGQTSSNPSNNTTN